jgi:hypothetical protein
LKAQNREENPCFLLITENSRQTPQKLTEFKDSMKVLRVAIGYSNAAQTHGGRLSNSAIDDWLGNVRLGVYK